MKIHFSALWSGQSGLGHDLLWSLDVIGHVPIGLAVWFPIGDQFEQTAYLTRVLRHRASDFETMTLTFVDHV